MDYLKKLSRSLTPKTVSAGEASSSETAEPQGRTVGRSSSMRIPDALSSLLARRSTRRSQSMDLESRQSREELAKLKTMQHDKYPLEAMLDVINFALLPNPPQDTRFHAEIKAQRRERYDLKKLRQGPSRQGSEEIQQLLQERLRRAAYLKSARTSASDLSTRLPPLEEHPSGSTADAKKPPQDDSSAKSVPARP